MRTDSILDTIKTLMDIDQPEECNDFDINILVEINSAIGTLSQLGVKPPKGFILTDSSTTWEDYLGEDNEAITLIPSYIAAKVKMSFDPPTSGTLMDSLNRRIDNLEWRINVMVDNGDNKEKSNE